MKFLIDTASLPVNISLTLLCIIFWVSSSSFNADSVVNKKSIKVTNPYEDVDWDTYTQHKAAFHVHTLQSDGFHMLEEVVRAYKIAGFTILAITDHDKMEPNAQFERGRIDWADYEEVATPYPDDPKPADFPTNTTWPWSDFGAPDPREMGMVGIEGAEISFLHHMNSFFSDYGVLTASSEDEQLQAMKEAGGIAIFNHPSNAAPFWGGERRSLEWYIKRFDKYSADLLIGMDIPGGAYDEGLWDQLLVRFMPDRPIWGFATDDMHRLDNTRQYHTMMVLDTLSDIAVRDAMERGQFYFTKSTRRIDLRNGLEDMGVYPTIDRIEIDPEEGTITIKGSDYDNITWISAPASLDPVEDYQSSNQPWPLGQPVSQGPTLNYLEAPDIQNYVRAELIHYDGEHTYRTFTNPFGFIWID